MKRIDQCLCLQDCVLLILPSPASIAEEADSRHDHVSPVLNRFLQEGTADMTLDSCRSH